MSDEQPVPTKRPWWFWPAAAAGTATFIVLLIWGPWWIEGHHLRDSNGELVSSAAIIITGFRTMLVAIAAGGFTAAGLYYTHRSHQHTVAKDREQANLTREGQVTGRYVDAVKLLASDSLHERLGGIYALERIMKDSERDHPTVVDVLSAFIRTRLKEDEQGRNGERTTNRNHEAGQTSKGSGDPDLVSPAEDVAAALSVLNRRPAERRHTVPLAVPGAELCLHDLEDVSWPWADLTKANLLQARLVGADLEFAILTGATLNQAKLAGATLRGASLEEAKLSAAVLTRADLTGVDLESANLTKARLDRTDLREARLNGADLTEANLSKARLHGARLYGAKLFRANLTGARLDEANLERADLRRARLAEAQLGGTRLHRAKLTGADLRQTNLDGALGLTVSSLLEARIDRSTTLPAEFASDPKIQNAIENYEAELVAEKQAREAELEALVKAAVEATEASREDPPVAEGAE
ncbi:pentapeptide repeat-containing protein [Streptomyces sp. NPDC059639]|uniref:pentapeptide repeat-containing protein n=1 Tax=Streptomyces sp. NPDC059639 TaxID=3346891 RepID=UPI003676D93E